jgi:type I restriction enzyme S subunit
MGLKVFTIDFVELAIDPKVGLKDYSCLYKNGVRLKSFLINQNVQTDIKSGRTPSRFNEDYWNGEYEFLTMTDVDTLTFSVNSECVDKITDYAVEKEKTLYQAKQNSLIVSNAMTVGLTFLLNRPVYINQNVFEVNLDETKVNKKFVLWYLNLIVKPLFQTTYTSKYLSKDELGRIKIPLIPKSQQDQIVAQIEPIENKIKELKSTIRDPQEIIDEVFARKFGFELEKFEVAKKQKFFEVDFSIISKTNDLKFNVSTSLNNKVNFQIPNVKYLTIKSIAKDIFAGGDMPKDFSDEKDEEYKYPIYSNGKENLGFVAYCKKPRVQEKATTISARGTIGFAVARNESYFPIVRLISIIPDDELILNEYLANVINFLNIEKSGNTIAQLTTPMVEKIKIPVPDKKIQQKIVDEIKAELDKQEEIKKQIEQERNKIDEIIENAIK